MHNVYLQWCQVHTIQNLCTNVWKNNVIFPNICALVHVSVRTDVNNYNTIYH